jgi:hypothetical protein
MKFIETIFPALFVLPPIHLASSTPTSLGSSTLPAYFSPRIDYLSISNSRTIPGLFKTISNMDKYTSAQSWHLATASHADPDTVGQGTRVYVRALDSNIIPAFLLAILVNILAFKY